MPKNRETIALDFDGVIHKYSKGWHDGSAYDPPMDGAIEHIKKLMERYTVYVFSTRDPQQIQDWFGKYGEQIPTQLIPADQMFWVTPNVLGIARHKVVAYVWLDDRALRFEGDWNRAYKSINNLVEGQPIAHNGETSDGWHTFDELYHYRMLYNAAFLNELHAHHKELDIHKSWRHSDGELCFGKDDYFVVVAQLPVGQVTNHYHGEFWDLFQIPEKDRAAEYDGHTPAQAATRMEEFIRGKGY